MDYNKKLVFSAVDHGFHFYRRAWVPTKSEKRICAHDKNKEAYRQIHDQM